MHKTWSLFLGRFQTPKPHAGHTGIIDKLLSEGKNVIIGLRKEDFTEKNPYSWYERAEAFRVMYQDKISEGRIKIKLLDDIDEVCYGRTPGWKIREVRLDPETESISATEIRKNL